MKTYIMIILEKTVSSCYKNAENLAISFFIHYKNTENLAISFFILKCVCVSLVSSTEESLPLYVKLR